MTLFLYGLLGGMAGILLQALLQLRLARILAPAIALLEQDQAQLQQQLQDCQRQCFHLREERRHQQQQVTADCQDATFAQLQTLLTNYPSARQMAAAKPDLPAKNVLALLTPLENLLQDWGIEPIGYPWQSVPYDPQWHQPDGEDFARGEAVYIRFIGYRQGDRILCPARVSRTLPPGVAP